jgi:signal transduction histidine kinase
VVSAGVVPIFFLLSERLQCLWGADDDCDRANQKWLSTLGLDSVNWNTWGDKIHPDDVHIATDAYAHAIDTQMGYANPIEIRILDAHRPGQYCDVCISYIFASRGMTDPAAQIIYDLQPEFSSEASGGSSGELLGWVGVWSDISVMRALQRQAFEAERAHTAEAERNRELQEQFIDITCHELRNPLNAIYNSAALLGESLAKIEGSLGALAKKDEGIAEREEFAIINAELQEDIDSANTIVLCARHQKRITDGTESLHQSWTNYN